MVTGRRDQDEANLGTGAIREAAKLACVVGTRRRQKGAAQSNL